MFTTFVTALDWSGTAVFALTGALMAARRQMDILPRISCSRATAR